MSLLHRFLNLTVPPLGLAFLAFLAPVLTAFRAIGWLFKWPEYLADKVVVITGASSGVGEHLAYEYAKQHAILVLAARHEDGLRTVAEAAKAMGAREVRVKVTDVAKEEDCKHLIDFTVQEFGRIDHLVNNAGVAHSYFFEEAEDAAGIRSLLDVSFWGSVYPTFYALEHLRRSRGLIMVTDSVAAFLPVPRMALYNAAKAGLLNFYDSLRTEVEPNVSITIAMPGWTESMMTMGRFMTDKGSEIVDQEKRQEHVGPFPVAPAELVAKRMVHAARMRQRYVVVPYWYSVFLYYAALAPEYLTWFYRVLYLPSRPGVPAPSKQIMDTTRAEKVLYPQSIQRPA